MFSIIRLTFKEAFSKKVFFGLFLLSNLVSLVLMFTFDVAKDTGDKAFRGLFGGQTSVSEVVHFLEGTIASVVYIVSLLISISATADFIPNLITKGNIDVIISKPISRTQILIGRVLGVFAIVAFNILYITLFTWIIISVKTGVWNTGFLVSALITLLTFLTMYSFITLLGILTKGTGVTQVIAFGTVITGPFLLLRDAMPSGFAKFIIDLFYYIIPKVSELGRIVYAFATNGEVKSYAPVYNSIGFIVIVFSLSIYLFNKKDF